MYLFWETIYFSNLTLIAFKILPIVPRFDPIVPNCLPVGLFYQFPLEVIVGFCCWIFKAAPLSTGPSLPSHRQVSHFTAGALKPHFLPSFLLHASSSQIFTILVFFIIEIIAIMDMNCKMSQQQILRTQCCTTWGKLTSNTPPSKFLSNNLLGLFEEQLYPGAVLVV